MKPAQLPPTTIALLAMAPFLFVLALVTGCTAMQSAQHGTTTHAEIADILLSVSNEYNAAWEALDPVRIAKFHAEDFTYYRQGVIAAASPEEFQEMYHDDVATQITAYRADTSEVVVKTLAPDAGIVAFLFRGEVTTPNGATHEYSGALTYVFERRMGEWKVVHIHESLLPHIQG